jgi:hypothetical protein
MYVGLRSVMGFKVFKAFKWPEEVKCGKPRTLTLPPMLSRRFT